jgi:aspartate aminotransferase-like enzyme
MANQFKARLGSVLSEAGSDERQVAAPKKRPERDTDAVRHTLYLPQGVYDLLLETAVARRTKIQRIAKEAIDAWLEREGLPSWAEAEKRGRL